MNDETKPEWNTDAVTKHLDELIERNAERRAYLRGLDGATTKSNEEKTFLELCDLAEIMRSLIPPRLVVDEERETKPKKKS